MSLKRMLLLLVWVLLTSSPVLSASVNQARQLHERGQSEEALAAIDELLSSDAAGDQKAAALDLRGSIEVEKGRFSLAKQTWAQLQDEFPDYAADNDVRTKLLLVSALLKSREGAAPTVAEAEPAKFGELPPAPPVSAAPSAAPAMAEAEAPAEPPSPAPPAQPKEEPAPAPVPQAPSGLVLVAVKGRPYDAMIATNERIVAFLREQGVDAVSATSGVPVVEDSKMVLPSLLQKGEDEGAGSILLVSANYAGMQKIVSECYSPEGATLWKLKTSGGTGTEGRPYSKTGITESLLERHLEKLGKKLGDTGVPITLK